MGKIVIIMNGHGGSGKDTLCGFAEGIYSVRNVSSAEPIKEIARKYGGWQGEKDEKSRKFLADLKRLFADYNDLPCRYLVGEYEKFLESGAEILFVHIREGKEIDKFRKHVDIPCIALLIRRKLVRQQWGNESDDNVEQYAYDYCYDNDKELKAAEPDFQRFLKEIMETVCKE
ncbi:hypothetical protein FMM74_001995 [Lachnospiraceae bacterium MD308]|nr:hypothetical protein [Lachnospiraceae bacterium MD308]